MSAVKLALERTGAITPELAERVAETDCYTLSGVGELIPGNAVTLAAFGRAHPQVAAGVAKVIAERRYPNPEHKAARAAALLQAMGLDPNILYESSAHDLVTDARNFIETGAEWPRIS